MAISNLILVLVISISFGNCDFYQEPDEENSSPETTHFEVTGLNEKQVNQIAVAAKPFFFLIDFEKKKPLIWLKPRQRSVDSFFRTTR